MFNEEGLKIKDGMYVPMNTNTMCCVHFLIWVLSLVHTFMVVLVASVTL